MLKASLTRDAVCKACGNGAVMVGLPSIVELQIMILYLKKQVERSQHKTIPLHKQLTLSIIEAILNGEIKPGESLPSSRKLAKQLSVSRCTVNNSYEELISLGFIETAPCKSVFVSKNLQTDFAPASSANRSCLDKVSHPWFHSATT